MTTIPPALIDKVARARYPRGHHMLCDGADPCECYFQRARRNAAIDLSAVYDDLLVQARGEVEGPIRALADKWRKYHDDSHPNAYTIIYGDAANAVHRALSPSAATAHDAGVAAAAGERIAQAIEALKDHPARSRYVLGVDSALIEAARIARAVRVEADGGEGL